MNRGFTLFVLTLFCLPSLVYGQKEAEADTLRTHNLEDFVVTVRRLQRPLKLSPIATQVIDGKRMAGLGYGSIETLLRQQTAGLNVQKAAFGNELNLQGLDARHVTLLLDGERMAGDMAGNIDFERLNIHSIDRIEIVKGASSTIYGSRASTGAVVDFITKKSRQPLEIDAGMRWGQMNELNFPDASPKDFLWMFEKNADRPNLQAWLSMGAHLGSFTSQTDAWYGTSDAYNIYQAGDDAKVYTREANPFLPSDTTILSDLKRPVMGVEGSEHLTLSQKVYFEPSDRFKAMVYGNLFQMNQYDGYQNLAFTQSEDYTVGGRVSWSFRDWFTLSAALHADFYTRYKRHEIRDERKMVYASRILRPRLSLTSTYFTGHTLTLGVEHPSDELTSDRFAGKGSREMLSRALSETEAYLQDEWTLSDRWLLNLGLRTSYTGHFGFAWMPALAGKFSPDEHWSFRAVYAKGYRAPSIKELFFNWDHLGIFMIRGDEFMRPERNDYVSIGAEYSDARFFVSGALYGNFYRDKIEGVWKIYDMQYNFEYRNLSFQRILGCEILARWQPSDSWTLNASYSYADISRTNGLRLNPTSPHAATASVRYAWQKGKNYRLSASLSASVMGAKSYDIQDRLRLPGEQFSHEAYFRIHLPAYFISDLSVTQVFFDKVKVTLGVDNLTDYIPSTIGSGLTAFNVPATPGRRFFVQIETSIDRLLGFD